MFSLVFTRRYAMAHRLIAGASERCAVPHGHNELVTVRLQATRPAALCGHVNMVESFESAKTTWHRWIDTHVDHALQLSNRDPLLDWFRTAEPARLQRILVTQGDPTTEMLAACMLSKINAFLTAAGGTLVCRHIEIAETPTNTVTLDGDPRDVLPQTGPAWWTRADMTINDLHLAQAPSRAPALV